MADEKTSYATKDGIQQLQEYYPNALEKTYKGVSGYIYSAESITDSGFEIKIPNAASCNAPVKVVGTELVPDAYDAILEAEEKGLIAIMRYEEMLEKMRKWIRRTILQEYEENADHPEYLHFLNGFSFSCALHNHITLKFRKRKHHITD